MKFPKEYGRKSVVEGYCGKFGHGKSYYWFWRGLRLAEQYNKYVVTNVPDLNLEQVYKYCLDNQLHRVASKIRRGLWFEEHDFNRILSYENAVVMADECGVFLNNRDRGNWGEKKSFFGYFLQLRKNNCDFLYVVQDVEMIDANVRRLTNFWYHCINSHPDNKPRWYRRLTVMKFDSVGYFNWLSERTTKAYLRNRIGLPVIAKFEGELFKCFNTLARLDGSTTFDLVDVARQLHGLDGELVGTRGFRPIIIPEDFVFDARDGLEPAVSPEFNDLAEDEAIVYQRPSSLAPYRPQKVLVEPKVPSIKEVLRKAL